MNPHPENQALEFKSASLRPNILKLFNQLAASTESRARFVENPTGVTMVELLPGIAANLSPNEISASNRFLFSALRNPIFLKQLLEFQKDVDQDLSAPENKGKTIDELVPRARSLKAISAALLASGDPEIIESFADAVAQSRGPTVAGPVSHDVAIVTAIAVALIVVITAIDVTPRVAPPGANITLPDLKSLADAITAKIKP